MAEPRKRWDAAATGTLVMVLLQPSLVLIDHGHFQYNSVCLGLAMGAASAVAGGQRRGGESTNTKHEHGHRARARRHVNL